MPPQKKQKKCNSVGFSVGPQRFTIRYHDKETVSKTLKDSVLNSLPKLVSLVKGINEKHPDLIEYDTKQSYVPFVIDLATLENDFPEFAKQLATDLKPANEDEATLNAYFDNLAKTFLDKARAKYLTYRVFTDEMRVKCKSNKYKPSKLVVPGELLNNILSFLNFACLAKASAVCKEWYRIISTPTNVYPPLAMVKMAKQETLHDKESSYSERQENRNATQVLLPLIARMGHLVSEFPGLFNSFLKILFC